MVYFWALQQSKNSIKNELFLSNFLVYIVTYPPNQPHEFEKKVSGSQGNVTLEHSYSKFLSSVNHVPCWISNAAHNFTLFLIEYANTEWRESFHFTRVIHYSINSEWNAHKHALNTQIKHNSIEEFDVFRGKNVSHCTHKKRQLSAEHLREQNYVKACELKGSALKMFWVFPVINMCARHRAPASLASE